MQPHTFAASFPQPTLAFLNIGSGDVILLLFLGLLWYGSKMLNKHLKALKDGDDDHFPPGNPPSI